MSVFKHCPDAVSQIRLGTDKNKDILLFNYHEDISPEWKHSVVISFQN